MPPITKSLVLALALTSCASVSVERGTEVATEKMPELVVVASFGAPNSVFAVDRTGKELADFKANLQLMLQTGIVTDLTDRLVPAAEMNPKVTKRGNVWILRGDFVTVNQGSRLLRGAIGFGAGGTKVETRVRVFHPGNETPFLTFATTGGSGAEPGAILAFTTDPLEIAIGAVSGAAHGLSEDTKRTARMITAELSDYMHNRGWIPESKWIKPKRLSGGDVW